MSAIGLAFAMSIENRISYVASPCVRNCCLDENEVCMGCGRHINEILAWHQSSGKEREEILAQARRRLIQKPERYKK